MRYQVQQLGNFGLKGKGLFLHGLVGLSVLKKPAAVAAGTQASEQLGVKSFFSRGLAWWFCSFPDKATHRAMKIPPICAQPCDKSFNTLLHLRQSAPTLCSFVYIAFAHEAPNWTVALSHGCKTSVIDDNKAKNVLVRYLLCYKTNPMERHAMTPPHSKLTGKLLIDTAMGSFLGDKRIRLLEAIDKTGSISQAAKAVPLSYKAAWDAVDDMNNVGPRSRW
jgi:hypothetical protein